MKVLMMIRTSREGGLLRFAGISLVQYLGGGGGPDTVTIVFPGRQSSGDCHIVSQEWAEE